MCLAIRLNGPLIGGFDRMDCTEEPHKFPRIKAVKCIMGWLMFGLTNLRLTPLGQSLSVDVKRWLVSVVSDWTLY